MKVSIEKCIKDCKIQDWNFKKGDYIFIIKMKVEEIDGKFERVFYTVDNERLTEKDIHKYFMTAGYAEYED